MLTDTTTETLTITILYPDGCCTVAVLDLTDAREYDLARNVCPRGGGAYQDDSHAAWYAALSVSTRTFVIQDGI